MLNSKVICRIGTRLLKAVALTKIVCFRRNVELFFMATEDLEERYECLYYHIYKQLVIDLDWIIKQYQLAIYNEG